MIKERAWPARAMYILIAAALAMSLIIMATPAQKVSASPDISEWSRVDTPTVEDWVLAPCSTIMDYALAEGGGTAYAVVGSDLDACDIDVGSYLLKSEDGAATWDDITDDDWIDDGYSPLAVATDGTEADFVAVALSYSGSVYVSISIDGGDTFEDPKLVDSLTAVDVFAVSPEEDDERDIAIGAGTLLYRATADGDSLGDWDDATDTTDYPGWAGGTVVEAQFSPSWTTDDTILVLTATSSNVFLQCGRWDASPGWNLFSRPGFDALPMPTLTGATIPLSTLGDLVAGIALPSDYDARGSDTRILWVWVNYSGHQSRIVRIDNDYGYFLESLGQIKQGNIWLTNISYWGTIDTGMAIAGVLGDGLGEYADCCEGVQVYRKSPVDDMSICCETWQKACKLPTGVYEMHVAYVSEDKAYAVALGPQQTCYDEGAWSVSFDDGYIWNQLSLVDTNIDYFSDVAVSPDCNKTFLVSVHKVTIDYSGCSCDSVWVHAGTFPEEGFDEYSGHWLRTWCDELMGDSWQSYEDKYEAGMLRLAPEETDGMTVYLFDYGTEYVYRNNLETLNCWEEMPSTEVDEIVDIAVQDADTIFALDAGGDVAEYDFDEDQWQEAVDSEVDEGNTIAVWGDWILVGGDDGEVSLSDDGGETFDLVEDIPTIDGWVTVAFDTYFDTNMTVYAATNEGPTAFTGGIYSWVIGEDEEWTDLKAEPTENQIFYNDDDTTFEVAFTGLVVDRPGNPFTDADNGGVIYASYVGYYDDVYFTGVARSLERDIDVCTTCLTWDFLHQGLTFDDEWFDAWPDALKICGCLTPDSNSHLFAIDSWLMYDMCENEAGSVWTYEDCYSKKAPQITYPADGDVIPADPCSCYSIPFTVLWDTLCDACSYDIAFALDEAFDMPVRVNGEEVDYTYHLEEQDVPAFSILGGEDGGLSCETTYYVRVRAADAATDELIHSWWSDPIAITIAPSVESGVITLVAPAPGATGVGTKNVGFSWDLLADADTFDWMLSANADLSSALDSKTGLTNKAATYTGTLEHDTTYYWQVKAYSEGALLSTSAIGTFTTGATGPFCSAIDGMCFDTEAELEAHNAGLAEEPPATPSWVWVVIAIGAVLVIVVIVLIFRTRRV